MLVNKVRRKKIIKLNKLKVFLVRHAESVANANEIVDTEVPGAPLSSIGINQSQTLASKLRFLKGKISAIYTSPFLRAQQTARIIAKGLGVKKNNILTDARIKELYYGKLNGLSSSKTVKPMGLFLKKIAQGDYQFRLGVCGENQQELLDRLYDFLIYVYKKHCRQTIIVVTHSVITTVIQKIILEALGKREKHKSLANAEFYSVKIDEKVIRKLLGIRKSLSFPAP